MSSEPGANHLEVGDIVEVTKECNSFVRDGGGIPTEQLERGDYGIITDVRLNEFYAGPVVKMQSVPGTDEYWLPAKWVERRGHIE